MNKSGPKLELLPPIPYQFITYVHPSLMKKIFHIPE